MKAMVRLEQNWGESKTGHSTTSYGERFNVQMTSTCEIIQRIQQILMNLRW